MIDPLGDDAARLLLEKMEYCADVQNGARNYRTEHVLRRAADTVRALLEERTRLREALRIAINDRKKLSRFDHVEWHYDHDDKTPDKCPECKEERDRIKWLASALAGITDTETQP
jgi:hypothetical protein